jgi:hypothetical protein
MPDRPVAVAVIATLALATGVVLVSRGLRDYDAALLPYTVGLLGFTFAVAYRSAAWLQRPAARRLSTRGLALLRQQGERRRALRLLARGAVLDLLLQRFILRRGAGRWVAHLLLSWGSLLAVAVTFPLVLGALHFDASPSDPRLYRIVVLGASLYEFHTESPLRHLLFNLLNLSSAVVGLGSALALLRRVRRKGLGRTPLRDWAPLLALFSVAATGALLTLSSRAWAGRGYAALAAAHAVSVLVALLLVPFGKLFHVVQRPLHLCVALARRAGDAGPRARCRGCGEAYAAALHAADVAEVLRAAGLAWPSPHAQLCPRCRRRLLGFSQGRARPRVMAGAA